MAVADIDLLFRPALIGMRASMSRRSAAGFVISARFNGVKHYVDVGTLNVPEGATAGVTGSGYSTSLWFDTTVKNGGLYGVVAGPRGDLGSDREVWLWRS
jgi:hypothetical protein